MDRPEPGCEHLRLPLPITRPVVGGTALKFLGSEVKNGRQQEGRREGQEAQRLANWTAGRGGGWVPGLRALGLGAGKAQGL